MVWSVAVGAGYLFGVCWGLALCGMRAAFTIDENLRGVIFVRRWYGMKWADKGFVRP